MAKGRKTGGRQKGSRNKASVKREAEIAGSGQTPLDFMLEIMRAPMPPVLNEMLAESEISAEGLASLINWYQQRFEAAKAAAPYVHPRLTATELTGKDGTPLLSPAINVSVGNGHDRSPPARKAGNGATHPSD